MERRHLRSMVRPNAAFMPTCANGVGEHDVLRLDVAVDHPMSVGIVQRLGHFAPDPECRFERYLRLPPEPVAERLALDIGHGTPELARRLAGVEHGHDMGVLQTRGDANLLQEPGRADGRGEFRCSSLSATGRPCRRSRARYTVAMPPRPSSRSST